MTIGLDRVREDWNKRAREDPLYWVYNVHGRNRDDWEACYRLGAFHAHGLLAIRDTAFDPQGKSILDIGCGVGRLFPGFADLGFSEIVGVDISPEMVERGRAQCPVEGARFYLVEGDNLSPIESNSIDYCFSYNVFAHFPDVRTFWANIREMERVLRPGGQFQIHFRGSCTLRQRFFRALPEPLRPSVHLLYRMLSLKWLRGSSIRVREDDPVHSETLELGRAVSPQYLAAGLREMGFRSVKMVLDADYPGGRRFWALGEKDPVTPAGTPDWREEAAFPGVMGA